MKLKTITKFKKTLILASFLCGHASTIASPQYSLDDVNVEAYKVQYNSLSSVDENDLNLKTHPKFSKFLKQAEEIVVQHELEEYVGLRLIHAHFPVGNNQVMLEEFQTVGGVPSLVTSAHNLSEAYEKEALPSSWIFSNTGLQELNVFETSTDPAVKAGIAKMQREDSFIKELGQLLDENQLNSLLSVAILKRQSLPPTKDDVFLEKSNNLTKKSIVQLYPEDQLPQSLLPTSWGFGPSKSNFCNTYCLWTTDPSGYIRHRFVGCPI